jgi:hypothetical protein
MKKKGENIEVQNIISYKSHQKQVKLWKCFISNTEKRISTKKKKKMYNTIIMFQNKSCQISANIIIIIQKMYVW